VSIEFKKELIESSFLDPRNNFEPKTVAVEIRRDPLTHKISRVFPYRNLALHKHNWVPFVEESKKKFCPFCPEVMEKVTPKFIGNISEDGRIRIGDAVAIPNLNPYEKYAAVVIMSSNHYIPMEEINEEFMLNSFLAGLTYLQKVYRSDPEGAAYPSINWNYMPYAGGSLIHPHLQVLAGATPCSYDQQLIDKSASYFSQYNSNFWTDLIKTEKLMGERYIGNTGDVHWLSTFAPRHIGEVLGILPGKKSINDLTKKDLLDFIKGLKKVISYYSQYNIASFNTALYFSRQDDQGFTVQLRTVGRFTIFPLAGSDITHMQILHDDPWTVILPEAVTAILKEQF